ncbi:MotA/TolQ/ExbB proton channel family protein [Halomonas stenophila]|uniref:Biopolymer transport protein ExbB n=1 Tax=Halomonas stenophila TaxID=795312 RepID=A0A7W5EUH3_9GAMM|nr:MotA/TolQ/ExbB proton channel family protein [Halomonas stenophila]MBB3231638.1 biopolymer transport protein ExbB [Halomonas stenophila]
MIRNLTLRAALAGLLLGMSLLAQAQEGAAATDAPLETLRAEREAAEARDRARLAELVDDEQALDAALEQARAELAEVRERRETLDSRQQAQTAELEALQARRQEQGGDLEAVFDEVAGVSGELRDELSAGWLTLGAEAGLPPRLDADGILRAEQLATLADSLMGLTRETARVVGLQAPVAGADGEVAERTVIRLGDLLAASDGQLLERAGEDGRLTVLPHTPAGVAERLQAFQAGEGEVVSFDPADGRVLEALARQPTLWERFRQGGAVGYVVVALGLGGLLVALGQYLYLLRVTVTLRRQLGDLARLRDDNPLGRALQRFQALGTGHAPEALEARLDEALLAEQPRLERGQGLVKMLAAVAPLLGLLGTVTGMIVTFQSITVFGTGDPQLMAGGISQALVTTVLGLITAVPLLFAHTALSSRSRALIGTLEGRASAVLADTLEAGRTASPREAPRHADALA